MCQDHSTSKKQSKDFDLDSLSSEFTFFPWPWGGEGEGICVWCVHVWRQGDSNIVMYILSYIQDSSVPSASDFYPILTLLLKDLVSVTSCWATNLPPQNFEVSSKSTEESKTLCASTLQASVCITWGYCPISQAKSWSGPESPKDVKKREPQATEAYRLWCINYIPPLLFSPSLATGSFPSSANLVQSTLLLENLPSIPLSPEV